jgi:hypothetical protein
MSKTKERKHHRSYNRGRGAAKLRRWHKHRMAKLHRLISREFCRTLDEALIRRHISTQSCWEDGLWGLF